MNNLHKINGGGYFYHSPEIEVYSTAVEQGFQASLTYGDPDAAGSPFENENGDGGYNDLGGF